MLAKRVIACLDVKNGRVVKGTKFQNIKEVDSPEKLGKFYSENGIDELVFYDITASNEERKTSLEFVEKVADVINIPFCVGGGVNTVEDFKYILRKGADKVSINSSAVKNPNLINEASKAFGNQCVVLSIDVKKNPKKTKEDPSSWNVYIKGGREKTELDAINWAIEGAKRGAGEIVVNSIDEDGMKNGYDIELLEKITKAVNIPVIASGGAGKMHHFLEVAKKTDIDGMLAASVFHFGEIKIENLKKYLKENGVEMRITQNIKYNKEGLVPCICQDWENGEVLMMAYMNEESLTKTIETKKATYYSRSRNELWEKGATSGSTQEVKSLYYDCDIDTVLIKVIQSGSACHTGKRSCFFNVEFEQKSPENIIGNLYKKIIDRKENPCESSYTNYLFDKGLDKILKKLGEESAETIIAAKNNNKEELIYESSDLIYHLLVLLAQQGILPSEIKSELANRFVE